MSSLFSKIHKAWEWRRTYVEKNRLEAFCLVNSAGDALSDLRVDYYAGAFQIVYKNSIWFSKKEELFQALREISQLINPRVEMHFFEEKNFSGSVHSFCANKKIMKKIVSENECCFEIHLGEGLHTGLFLDQRENRRNIYFNAKGRRVLNLFAHTGAFSIVALKAGADQVVSVDLSKKYLEWLKRNVILNGLALEQSPVWARDVFDYLKLATKKNEKFDLIILDPPTFSRSGKETFSTERDLKKLLSLALPLLAPQGNLFFSINTLKMSRLIFQQQVEEVLSGFSLRILKFLSVPRDFKLTPLEEKNPYLKACWVGK